jgi:Mg-chelatase subunit ChlD
MFRWWAFWRRTQYLVGFLIVFSLIGTGLYYMYGYEAPTCFDKVQNGEERGIDCGGACARMCTADITAPVALWAESFRITEGQYNAVAYVENRNREFGTQELSYTFKLYDERGAFIAERTGKTVLPPDGVYPIFEGRISAEGRIPSRTIIEFGKDSIWLRGDVGRDQFELERRELENADNKPRLNAEIRNTSLEEALDVEVVATIFDSSRNPLTASRTFIPIFAGRSTENIFFTWPEPIAKTLKSCEIPTDVMLAIDLSGSMNNDSANPPEPISSVLLAAKAFAGRLKAEDKIGLVTYATEATVNEMLTNESTRVAEVISKLVIDPKEEQGSTNTGEALKRMREELGSVRHNEDARKVAILLTDGLATAPGDDPEMYARGEADALKALGALVFTIGLGETANEEFLRSLASDAAMYHKAPTTRELSSIYSAITESICEDGPTVIEIIAKPKTSFR